MTDKISVITKELQQYIGDAMQNQVFPENSRLKRRLELHPSSFPYCALRDIYEFVQEAPDLEGTTTFATSYFTSVGTLVHTLIQRFMAMGGKVWGFWKCRHLESGLCSYNNTKDLQVYHNCPLCGSACEYEEVGFKLHNLDGHMDCLYEDRDGDFWVIDYKTCLLSRATGHMKALKFLVDGKTLANNPTYRAQQRAYVTLVHKKYGKSKGIKPKGYVLVYIPRDIPFSFTFHGEVVTSEMKQETWERIQYDIEALDTVLDAESYEDIAHLVDEKPCKSRLDYNKNMASPYSECPLLPVCFNKKQLVSTLRGELEDNVLLPMRKTIQIALKAQDEMREGIKKMSFNNNKKKQEEEE